MGCSNSGSAQKPTQMKPNPQQRGPPRQPQAVYPPGQAPMGYQQPAPVGYAQPGMVAQPGYAQPGYVQPAPQQPMVVAPVVAQQPTTSKLLVLMM